MPAHFPRNFAAHVPAGSPVHTFPAWRSELERLHADRIAAMKQEAERRAELERKGHGTYEEVTEGDFLEVSECEGGAGSADCVALRGGRMGGEGGDDRLGAKRCGAAAGCFANEAE